MPTKAPSEPMISSQPCRIAASTATLTLARADDLLPLGRQAGRGRARSRAPKRRARRPRARCSSLRASTAMATSDPVANSETSAILLLGRRDLIGAGAQRLASSNPSRNCGRFWRVRASTLGRSCEFSSASCQHSTVSTASHGPEHEEVRDRPQRSEMLDRLVGRAVLAEPDRIVRHHMDDALAHERGQPDGRPAVVGEHQERAGIGNDPPVQRHAVHGRRHAVLAHAVMDEAAGIIGGGEHRHAFRPGVVGAGEVGRAADHFRHRGGQGFERAFGCGAGRDLFRRCGELLLHRAHRRGEFVLGSSPRRRRSNSARRADASALQTIVPA